MCLYRRLKGWHTSDQLLSIGSRDRIWATPNADVQIGGEASAKLTTRSKATSVCQLCVIIQRSGPLAAEIKHAACGQEWDDVSQSRCGDAMTYYSLDESSALQTVNEHLRLVNSLSSAVSSG